MAELDNDGRWPATILSVQEYPESDHLEIGHDGTASWADLQAVKDERWGEDALAIEVYPPASMVVNGNSVEFHFRHLWRMPRWQAWPNLRPEGSEW